MSKGKAKGKSVGGKSRSVGKVEFLTDKGDKKASDSTADVAKSEPSAVDETIESPGPTTGGTMPLFPGADPELRCSVTRTSDRVVVSFSKPIDEWSLKKRQTKLACRLIDAQAGELHSPKVSDVKDLEADLDLGAEIVNDGACVVVRFETKTKEWKLHKRGAMLATGLIRARSRPLPAESS